MQYGKALALAGEYRKAKKVLEQSRFYLTTNVTETTLGDVCQALKQYKEAETAYTKAAGMIPNRFYPEYLLAKLYNDTQQPEKAYYTAQRLLGKEIKVHSAAIDEMRAEMKLIVQQCSSYKSPNNH